MVQIENNPHMKHLQPALFVILVCLGGCTSTPRGVEWDVDQSCQENPLEASSYAVTMEDMPGFIEPAFSFAAHQSMQRVGLVPSDDSDEPDIRIILRFEQVSLDPPEDLDDFGESVVPGPLTRFNAIVWVTVETSPGTVVWSGSMNRSHAIVGHEIFHTDRAITLLQVAFDSFFENLFQPCVAENQE